MKHYCAAIREDRLIMMEDGKPISIENENVILREFASFLPERVGGEYDLEFLADIDSQGLLKSAEWSFYAGLWIGYGIERELDDFQTVGSWSPKEGMKLDQSVEGLSPDQIRCLRHIPELCYCSKERFEILLRNSLDEFALRSQMTIYIERFDDDVCR